MIGPIFEASALADPDSLAGKLIAGDGPVHLPDPGELALPSGQSARIELDAFGTTSTQISDKLAAVLQGEGLIVSTGQQPVLFLGPLYVVYKALTAIELAAAIETQLDVPVVPVFWIASDDHDWEEIGQATFLDKSAETTTMRFHPPEGAAGRSAGPTPVGPGISDTLAEMSQLLPQAEFRGDYLEQLRGSYAVDATVADGFAGALRAAMGDAEFAWLDSSHPSLRAASAPFFLNMIEAAPGVLAAMDAGEKQLRDAGFDPPIAPLEGGLPLFYDDGEKRQRVLRTSDAEFAAGRGTDGESVEVWRARLEDRPDRFSPSVSSRPALESWLMPVAATVLGPGEIAYWSQLPPVFDHYSTRFPAIVPRASLCAVEAGVEKTLRRMDLSVEDLKDGGDAVAAQVTADARPADVDAAIGDLRSTLGDALTRVQTAVAEDLPGLKSAAGKAGKALHDAIAQLNRQVDAAVRERQETTLLRVRRAASVLWPGRRRQERVLNPFHFLAKYGPEFVDSARLQVRNHVSEFLAGSADDS